MTAEHDATAALAHRLRLAAHHSWSGEICDAEAATFIATLQALGWRWHQPAPAGRAVPANPAVAALRAEQARQAIRAATGKADCAPPPKAPGAPHAPRVPEAGSGTPNPAEPRTDDPTQGDR